MDQDETLDPIEVALLGSDQDELWKFNVPGSERHKILKRLEQYNINAFSLFGSEESLMETLSFREMLSRER